MNKSLFFYQQIPLNQDKIITLLSYHYFWDNYHKNEVVYVCGSIGGLLAVSGTELVAVDFCIKMAYKPGSDIDLFPFRYLSPF